MDSTPPHILVLPFPAQGHVIPLMQLSHILSDSGFTITFLNTHFNHARVTNSLSQKQTITNSSIKLVSIQDGMGPGEDRNDLARLCESMMETVPGEVERVVREIEEAGEEKVSWIVADLIMMFACRSVGVRTVAFWPAASALLALTLNIPKLIEEGVLTDEGLPLKTGMIKLSPEMPPMDTSQFSWNLSSEPSFQKHIYQFVITNNKASELAEFIVSNSFYGLESATFDFMPNILPIGPIVADDKSDKPIGHFWTENESCINWLDEQPEKSVIYVAFGSFTIFNNVQFQEIALGLEQCGQPFLWVVRPDLTNGEIEGIRESIGNRGRIVEWSPQQKVLAHPSVACFVTHCGWNSTIEGVRNGVPLLCWPYFCDQFLNQSYICDVWKVGLRLSHDENGIITKEEIKLKVEKLLKDVELKERSLVLKKKADESVRVGGSSYINMNNFIDAIREKITPPVKNAVN